MDLNTIFKNLPNNLSWLEERSIFLTIHGSVAYGLNTPSSDIDIRGIAIPPKSFLYGFSQKFEDYTRTNPDAVIFNLKKFFNLASTGNPNVFELLFIDQEFHLKTTKLGTTLLENRDHFISKQLKERYVGYARSQAHRIKQHRKFILNPLTQPPTREELGLPSKPQIKKNQYDAIKALISKQLEQWEADYEPFSDSQKIYLQNKVADILTEMQISKQDLFEAAARKIGLDDHLILVIKQEKEYENKLEEYQNYLKWKEKRNPIRYALEEQYGYDTKHGSHLIRLLRMGKEILTTGKVQVKRIDDREELLAIKNGSWTYEQLIEYADKIEQEVKEAYQTSKLPNQTNIKYLDNLCQELIENSL